MELAVEEQQCNDFYYFLGDMYVDNYCNLLTGLHLQRDIEKGSSIICAYAKYAVLLFRSASLCIQMLP